MSDFVIVKNSLKNGMSKYFKMAKKGDTRAKKVMGLQLLNNILNGSPGSSVVPPIRTGHLRGSGSVFVGGTLVGDSSSEYPGGSPNRSFSANNSTITVGFDAPYAARMHEHIEPSGSPDKKTGRALQQGNYSQQSGDVDAYFVRKHIENDGGELMELYAAIVKKDTGG